MELIPVKSSNVEAVGYEGTTLTVKYKSGTYDYYDVPDEKWTEIKQAIAEKRSVGAVISGSIVRQHKFRRHEESSHGG